jgi:hypothetical protein
MVLWLSRLAGACSHEMQHEETSMRVLLRLGQGTVDAGTCRRRRGGARNMSMRADGATGERIEDEMWSKTLYWVGLSVL